MTEAEVRPGPADRDAKPLTPDDFKRMKRVPRAKIIRRALGLTQEDFSARFRIPLGTLRDWEQGAAEPDQAARALSPVIARNPKAVADALTPRKGLLGGRAMRRILSRFLKSALLSTAAFLLADTLTSTWAKWYRSMIIHFNKSPRFSCAEISSTRLIQSEQSSARAQTLVLCPTTRWRACPARFQLLACAFFQQERRAPQTRKALPSARERFSSSATLISSAVYAWPT